MQVRVRHILSACVATAIVAAAASPALAALCAGPASGAHPCCGAVPACATPSSVSLSRCCEAAPADRPATPADSGSVRLSMSGLGSQLCGAGAPAALPVVSGVLHALRSAAPEPELLASLDLPLRL